MKCFSNTNTLQIICTKALKYHTVGLRTRRRDVLWPRYQLMSHLLPVNRDSLSAVSALSY